MAFVISRLAFEVVITVTRSFDLSKRAGSLVFNQTDLAAGAGAIFGLAL